MGSMTNEAAFIELLHTLMQRQRETNAKPEQETETETEAEPTLTSAFAQGEINNTFIYTYVRYECACVSVCNYFFLLFLFFLATVITRHLSRLLSNEK